MDVRLPDGTVIKNVPDGTSKADLTAKLEAKGYAVPDAWKQKGTGAVASPVQAMGGVDQALSALNKFGAYAWDIPAQAKVAAHYASGALAAPIAGLAGIATGGDADTVRNVQNMLTYNPDNPNAQNAIGAADAVAGLPAAGADMAGKAVTDATGSPLAGAGVNTALQAIPMLLGARSGPRTAIVPKINETTASTLSDVAPLGVRVTPEYAGVAGTGPVAKAAEASGSMTKLQQALSKHNAEVAVPKAIGADLGIEGPVTPAAVAQRGADANAMYKAVRESDKNQVPDVSPNGVQLTGPDGKPLTKAAGPIQLGKDFYADADNIGMDRKNPDFATKVDPAIDDLRNELKSKTELSTDGIVSKINDLRQDARGNLGRVGATNADTALGRAQMQAADALEKQLGSYLQNQPGVYQAMLKGRELKAKVHSVENAMNEGNGNVDVSKLARDLDNGVPLSGNLLKLAKAYKAFPKVFMKPEALNIGQNSIIDTGLIGAGALRLAHGDLSGGAQAAAGMARPFARGMVNSDRYQQAMTSPQQPPLLSGLGSVAASPLAALGVEQEQQ